MIFLNKKRTIIYMCFFIISIFSCYLFAPKMNNKIVTTMALPVSDKVVILDAGHGFPDERGSSVKME